MLPNDATQKRSVRSAFGTLAPVYDTWYHTPLGKYVWTVEAAAVHAMLPQKVNGVVVDIGVGTGMSLSFLQPFSSQIVGVDNSWQMVNIAYQKNQENQEVHLVIGDGENLPFRSNFADLIIGMTVLEFVPNPDRFLQEVQACLHPKGWLVLGVLTSTNLWALERRIRSFVQPDVFSYAQFPSPWQLIRRLNRNGFYHVRYRGAVYAPTFTPKRCLATFSRLDGKLGMLWVSRSLGAFSVVQARYAETK
ncbi:MAG: class I SAM-dependent methyltransferase [Candidatus Hermodarchaeota archaeon]